MYSVHKTLKVRIFVCLFFFVWGGGGGGDMLNNVLSNDVIIDKSYCTPPPVYRNDLPDFYVCLLNL